MNATHFNASLDLEDQPVAARMHALVIGLSHQFAAQSVARRVTTPAIPAIARPAPHAAVPALVTAAPGAADSAAAAAAPTVAATTRKQSDAGRDAVAPWRRLHAYL